MPVYEYRCAGCGNEQELLLPMAAAGTAQPCPKCGQPMARLFSVPHPAVMVVTNKDNVMKTLNDEGGYGLPGKPGQRERYKSVMWQGMQQGEPVIGRGFGKKE